MTSDTTPLFPHAGATVRLELQLGCGLSRVLVAEINHVCDRVEDAAPGAVLQLALSGDGQDGGAAADVTLVNTWERALRRIERLSAPTVVTVNGKCGGLGLALLLTADYRIAAPDLRLGLALDGETLLPGMVLHRLANQIGVARARRMALFAVEIDAVAAHACGLVDDIAADPESAAQSFIGTLKRAELGDLPVRRRLILEAPSHTYEDGLGNHLAACDRALRNTAVRAPAGAEGAMLHAVAA
jgi:isomerase DpgB